VKSIAFAAAMSAANGKHRKTFAGSYLIPKKYLLLLSTAGSLL
jgi:hypothetical protein